MKSYRELIVWKKAVTFCTDIYKITAKFPKSEMYGLVSQMRRSVISIPSNIAEGQMRGHKEYIQFLRISYGSGAELETQLLIAKQIGYLSDKEYNSLNFSLDEVMRMLNKIISLLTNP